MGYVCSKHVEYVPEGTCRWCEAPKEPDIRIGYAGNLIASVPGWFEVPLNPASAFSYSGFSYVSPQIQTNGWVIPAPPRPPADPSLRTDILNAINSLTVTGK